MEESTNVAQVTQRLREIEDHNFAMRLQEEEFNRHYNRNREDRRLVGDDTKRSIREQLNEDEAARMRRLEANKKIAESDEELARRLQREFEEEARRQLEEQARRDAELAQRLAFAEQPHILSSYRTNPPTAVSSHAQPSTVSSDQPLIDLSTDDRTTTFTNYPAPVLTTDIFTPPTLMPAITISAGHDRYENVQMDPFAPGCSTSSTLQPTHGSPLLGVLHPTNPFLQDVAAQDTLQPTPQPPPYPAQEILQPTPQPPSYHSEFGLPPPSDLALGKRS